MDSQITDTEGTYSVGHNDNQEISVQSAQFSETGFTVISEQQESFYNHDLASMRPSNDSKNVSLPISSNNNSNGTCLTHTSITGAD